MNEQITKQYGIYHKTKPDTNTVSGLSLYMVENYMKDLKESVYHGAVVSVLAVGYTMLGKTIKMSPPSLGTFDVQDGVKLVVIVAISDFMKDYLIKQKIIPNNI